MVQIYMLYIEFTLKTFNVYIDSPSATGGLKHFSTWDS